MSKPLARQAKFNPRVPPIDLNLIRFRNYDEIALKAKFSKNRQIIEKDADISIFSILNRQVTECFKDDGKGNTYVSQNKLYKYHPIIK